MTVTITDDFTQINSADSVTNWTTRGQFGMTGVDTASNVEGSGCLQIRIAAAGIGDATNAHSSVDLTDENFAGWFRPSFPVESVANSGITVRISDASGGATDYGQWDVGGGDLGVPVNKGWIPVIIDVRAPFNSVNGTPPPITAVTNSGIGANLLAANGMDVPTIDETKRGSLITVAGGTTGARGTFQEIATAVLADGFVANAGGAFFIQTKNVHWDYNINRYMVSR